MRSITVKNIPDDIYLGVKNLAGANRRSMNSEILTILEDAVISKRFQPEEFLVRARQSREKTASYVITDEELNQAKRAGRK